MVKHDPNTLRRVCSMAGATFRGPGRAGAIPDGLTGG